MGKGAGHRKPDSVLESPRQSAKTIAKNLRSRDQSPTGNLRRNRPWTETEHRLFLLGLEEYGRGNWRLIAAHYVTTRTPIQVASHAQKFYLREAMPAAGGEHRRHSIHDIRSASAAAALTAEERASLRHSLQLANQEELESLEAATQERHTPTQGKKHERRSEWPLSSKGSSDMSFHERPEDEDADPMHAPPGSRSLADWNASLFFAPAKLLHEGASSGRPMHVGSKHLSKCAENVLHTKMVPNSNPNVAQGTSMHVGGVQEACTMRPVAPQQHATATFSQQQLPPQEVPDVVAQNTREAVAAGYTLQTPPDWPFDDDLEMTVTPLALPCTVSAPHYHGSGYSFTTYQTHIDPACQSVKGQAGRTFGPQDSGQPRAHAYARRSFESKPQAHARLQAVRGQSPCFMMLGGLMGGSPAQGWDRDGLDGPAAAKQAQAPNRQCQQDMFAHNMSYNQQAQQDAMFCCGAPEISYSSFPSMEDLRKFALLSTSAEHLIQVGQEADCLLSCIPDVEESDMI